MLEILVQKLLLALFGDYIQNLDKNKLSFGVSLALNQVLSGNLLLEDIIINTKFVTEMKLPFKLVYGRIGKIKMAIPWTNFFSSPTKIEIDNLHLALDMLRPNEWIFDEEYFYTMKLNLLSKFAETTMIKLDEAFKSKSDAGYFSNVMIKILDNLDIVIKNVILRLEDSSIHKYSLGVSLDSLKLINTNANWESFFIDRSKIENKNKDIYKLIIFSNFGLYTKSEEVTFLSEKDENDKKLFFLSKNYVYNYILSPISVIGKMVILNQKIENEKISLMVDLDNLKFEIFKPQYDCLIKFLNNISNYRKHFLYSLETLKYLYYRPKFGILHSNKVDYFSSKHIKNPNAVLWWKYMIRMTLKRQKYIGGNMDEFKIPEVIIRNWFDNFKKLFKKYFKNEKFEQNELYLFKRIIKISKLQDLFEIITPVLQEIDLENKKERNKKANSGLLAKFFSKKISDEVRVSKEDEDKIEEIIKKVKFEFNNTDVKSMNLSVSFLINEGEFSLLKLTNLNINEIEGLTVKFRKLSLNYISEENFYEINSGLHYFKIAMISKINKIVTDLPMTYLPNSVLSENYVWKINFQKFNSFNDSVSSSILSVLIKPSNFLFYQVFFKKVSDFFQVEQDDHIRDHGWEGWQNFKLATTKSLKDNISRKNIIDIKIEPMKVFLPINKFDFNNSRFLTIEIGQVMISQVEANKHYSKMYGLKISSISLSIYQSFKELIDCLNTYNFFYHDEVNFYLGLLKSNSNCYENPKILLSLILDKVEIKFSDYLFLIIFFITDVLKTDNETYIWSAISETKQEITRKSKMNGKVFKKNEILLNWEEYYAVLSGGYIYFYLMPSDEEYFAYYYIKDTKLTETIEKGENNNEIKYFTLRNHFGIIKLQFPSEIKEKQWLNAIKERLYEIQVSSYALDLDNSMSAMKSSPMISRTRSANFEDELDYKIISFGIEISIKEVVLCLLEENINESTFNKIITFSLQNLNFKLITREMDIDLFFSVKCLEGNDEDLHFCKKFISSIDPDNENSTLISVSILIADKMSPFYRNEKIEILINLSFVHVIWHPEIIRKIMKFFVHNDFMMERVLKEIRLPTIKFNECHNFVQKNLDIIVEQRNCESSKEVIKIIVNVSKLRIFWVQPVLNLLFCELRLSQSSLIIDIEKDHFVMKGNLGNTQIIDLTNYPFSIRHQRDFNRLNMREVLGFNDKSSLSFTFSMLYPNCPLNKHRKQLEISIDINSIKLNYIQQQFFRIYYYFFVDFLYCFSPPEKIVLYRKTKDNKKKIVKIESQFMDLKILIHNPQVLIKPRPYSEEYFLVDLGNIELTNSYEKVKGRLKIAPEDDTYISSFNLKLSQLFIVKNDGFEICRKTDALITMNFLYMTEELQNLNEEELDQSYGIEIRVETIEMKIRQIDFTHIYKFLDLNWWYTDYQDKYYSYLFGVNKVRKTFNPNMDKCIKLKFDLYFSNLVVQFLYDDFHIFCEIILLDKELNFVKYCDEKSKIFLNVKKVRMLPYHDNVCCEDILLDNTNDKERTSRLIRTSLHKSIIPENNYQLKIFIEISPEGEKIIQINIYHIKLIFRADTLTLLKNFIYQGFPVYNEKNLKDLPNQYDFNQDLHPKMKVGLEMNETLICFLSESIDNPDQDIICITCEIIFNYCRNKIRETKDSLRSSTLTLKEKVRSTMIDKNQRESYVSKIEYDQKEIYSMKICCLQVCPFICKKKFIIAKNPESFFKRKLVEEFSIVFEYNTAIKFITNNSYLLVYEYIFDFKNIYSNLAFNDIALIMKFYNYNSSLINPQYETILKILSQSNVINDNYKLDVIINDSSEKYNAIYDEILKLVELTEKQKYLRMKKISDLHISNYIPPQKKDSIIDKSISKMIVNGECFQITLINDFENCYSPFITFVIDKFSILIDNPSNFTSINTIYLSLEINLLNYLAVVWEPFLEKTDFHCEIINNYADPTANQTNININIPLRKENNSPTNLNFSNLSIANFYIIMNSWIDKFNRIITNEDERRNLYLDMKISNHKLFNYTGKPLTLYRVILKSDNINKTVIDHKIINVILPNESYDLEYLDEDEININSSQVARKEKYICFELDCVDKNKIKDNTINIDNSMFKAHKFTVENTILEKYKLSHEVKKYFILYTEIRNKTIKKHINFYSHLILKNKTQHSFKIIIRRKDLCQLNYDLLPKKKIGIPHEYFDGNIDFILDNHVQNMEILNFILSGQIQTIRKLNNIFLNFITNSKYYNLFRYISITSSYIVRNFLPYDIILQLPKTGEKYKIPKSDSIYLDSIFLTESFIVNISFTNFSTRNDVTIYDNKNKGPQRLIAFTVYDKQDNELILNAILVESSCNRIIIIYSSGMIINNTHMGLKYYYRKKKKIYEIAGQANSIGNVIPIYNHDFIYVMVDDMISDKLNLNSVGISTLVQCKKKDKIYEYIMDTYLSLVSKDLEIYTLIVTLSPRYIISNKLTESLLISIEGCETSSFEIKALDKSPFYYFGKGSKYPLIIKCYEIEEGIVNDKVWRWSQGISNDINDLTIQICSRNNDKKKLINIDKKVEGSITFFIFSEATVENSQFVIENYSKKISIKAYQKNYRKFCQNINIRSKALFAWIDQNDPNIICMEFYIGSLDEKPLSVEKSYKEYEIFQEKIMINKKSYIYPAHENISLKFNKNQGISFKIEFRSDGYYKKIIISEVMKYSSLLKFKISVVEVNIKIDELGMSLLCDNKVNFEKNLVPYKRKEILYIIYKQINVSCKKETLDDTYTSVFEINLKLQEIQIDNQCDYNTYYPIIFRTFKNKSQQRNLPALKMHLFLEKNLDSIKIKFLDCNIQSFIISIDNQFLEAILDFFFDTTAQMGTTLSYIDPIFFKDNSIEKANHEFGVFIQETNDFQPGWRNKNIVTKESKFYIQKLNISSFSIYVSLSVEKIANNLNKYFRSENSSFKFLQKCSNIDKININLSSMSMSNIYGKSSELAFYILNQYKQGILLQAIRIFISVLGRGLLKKMTGWIVEPVTDLMKMISKSDQNNVQILNIEGHNFKKRRKIRPLYGKYEIVKAYNENDAEAYELLPKIELAKKMKYGFSNSCFIILTNNDLMNLFFTTECIFLIEYNKKKIREEIPFSVIEEINLSDSKLCITFVYNCEYNKKNELKIEMNNQNNVKRIFGIIQSSLLENIKYINKKRE